MNTTNLVYTIALFFSLFISIGSSNGWGQNTDIALINPRSTEGYLKIPISQVFDETFEVEVFNNGPNTLDSVYTSFNLYYNGSLVESDVHTIAGLQNNSMTLAVSNFFSISHGLGLYNVSISSQPGGNIVDTVPSNNAVYFNFEVTDSVYARDNSDFSGVVSSVGGVDSAHSTLMFEIFEPSMVTGVWIRLGLTSAAGSYTHGVLWDFATSLPSNLIGVTDPVLITSGEKEYYMEFNPPIYVSPGKYAFGAYEPPNVNLRIQLNTGLGSPNVKHYYTNGIWSQHTLPGNAPSIRAIFGNADDYADMKDQLSFETLSVYPNPTNGGVQIELGEIFSEVQLKIINAEGRVVDQDHFENTNFISYQLQGEPGVYYMELIADNKQRRVAKLIKL